MKNKVLIVAVHPDDETLGCGGTLLRHKSEGDEIHWLICTSLDSGHDYYQQREQEIEQVKTSYEFDSVTNLRLKTTRLDEYGTGEIVDKISNVFQEIQPNIIYLPFKGDVHSDHRVIFQAAFSCTKWFRYPYIKKIYMVETLSETEFAPATKEDSFIPNVYVDISEFMDKKLEIMNMYSSEIGLHPFPRSDTNIKALGGFRGASIGCDYAESFMLLKEIV